LYAAEVKAERAEHCRADEKYSMQLEHDKQEVTVYLLFAANFVITRKN